MENIAGYVFDHTTIDESCWHRLGADDPGPYSVSVIRDPQEAVFREFIRLQAEKTPRCNPLDGRYHRLSEIAGWIGNRALARRFIGLGVLLGVFELVRQPGSPSDDDSEDMIRRLDRDPRGPLQLEAALRSEPIASAPSPSSIRRCREQPARSRPRRSRCGWRGTSGFSRSVVRGMAW